ncbi:IS66 family transposase [Pseudomonas entomophila]
MPRYLEDGAVAIDNNAVEKQIRRKRLPNTPSESPD